MKIIFVKTKERGHFLLNILSIWPFICSVWAPIHSPISQYQKTLRKHYQIRPLADIVYSKYCTYLLTYKCGHEIQLLNSKCQNVQKCNPFAGYRTRELLARWSDPRSWINQGLCNSLAVSLFLHIFCYLFLFYVHHIVGADVVNTLKNWRMFCVLRVCSKAESLPGADAKHSGRELRRSHDDDLSDRVWLQRRTFYQPTAQSFT